MVINNVLYYYFAVVFSISLADIVMTDKTCESNQQQCRNQFSYPKWDDANRSMMRKYLTEGMFEKLRDKQSKRGVVLYDLIKSGLANPDSNIGVYVGDQESYTLFSPLITAIIEDYHKPYVVTNHHPTDFNPNHLHAPHPDPTDSYIISTRIRVARNLIGHGLPATMTKHELLDVEKKVVEVLEGMGGEFKGKYYALKGIDEATRQKLVDDHFLFKKGDRFLEAAGINREWPEGRGIFHNDDKTFLVWVNEEDQLRIISMQPGGDIEAVFKRLAGAVNELSSKLGFQFDEHLGYLSSCPTNLGTGMRASVHVKIPNAIKHADYQATLDKYHIQARGIHGEHSESTDGIYDISNKRRLGLSEVECVTDMINGVNKLIELEQSMNQ